MYELDVIFVGQGSRVVVIVVDFRLEQQVLVHGHCSLISIVIRKTYQSNEFSKGADIMNERYLHEE